MPGGNHSRVVVSYYLAALAILAPLMTGAYTLPLLITAIVIAGISANIEIVSVGWSSDFDPAPPLLAAVAAVHLSLAYIGVEPKWVEYAALSTATITIAASYLREDSVGNCFTPLCASTVFPALLLGYLIGLRDPLYIVILSILETLLVYHTHLRANGSPWEIAVHPALIVSLYGLFLLFSGNIYLTLMLLPTYPVKMVTAQARHSSPSLSAYYPVADLLLKASLGVLLT